MPACFIKIQHNTKNSVCLFNKSVEFGIGVGPSHDSIYHPGNAYPMVRPFLFRTQAENYKQIELNFVWLKKPNLDLNSFNKIFYSL